MFLFHLPAWELDVDSRLPPGARIRSMRVHGVAVDVDDERTHFLVALTEFMAGGGDQCDAFARGEAVRECGVADGGDAGLAQVRREASVVPRSTRVCDSIIFSFFRAARARVDGARTVFTRAQRRVVRRRHKCARN